MSYPNQNAHVRNSHSEPGMRSIRKDYPSEVEEAYRQDSQRLIYKTAHGLVKEREDFYTGCQRK